MTVYTVGTSDLPAAIGNAKAGDTLIVKPGTVVMDGQFPQIAMRNLSLIGDGVTLRSILRPKVSDADVSQIVAMSALGLSGNFDTLSSTDKARVKTYIANNPIDRTAARALVDQYLAPLKPVTEARIWEAKPPLLGDINYNGRSYQFDVRWRGTLSKGIFTTKLQTWGTYIAGFRFQNARGVESNTSGIRSQGGDLMAERCIFEDCSDGILAGTPQSILNPNGDWYNEDPKLGRQDLYGFNIDKDCTYDNCGEGGLSHGRYDGNALVSLSVRAKAIRANFGHFLKCHGGLQAVIDGELIDLGDGGGLQQAVDMTSGAGYVINNKITKASSGNDGGPVLMRNSREPIPSWFEVALVVKGNVITHIPIHSGSFVRAITAQTFEDNNGDGVRWPGVPTNIRTIVQSNVFRCLPGSPYAKTPVQAPAGAQVSGNVVLGMNDVVPDVLVALPNYEWTRASYKTDLADLLSKVDPANTWSARLLSLPTYPASVSISYPEAQEDPAVIAELQAENTALKTDLAATKDALAASEAQKQALANTVTRAHAQAVDLSASAQALVGALE